MENMEHRIGEILERNRRVEADKAWETSMTRRAFITMVIYGTGCLFLRLIGQQYFFLQALVPTGGYILSTLSLPWLKRWWLKVQEDRAVKAVLGASKEPRWEGDLDELVKQC